jgi:hypothetical protein
MDENFFLEAHFYAGGLRHRAFTDSGDRPTWAPAEDSVGFTDDVALDRNTAAVELRRLDHSGHRLTWLAVYHASIDARLGDRSNHAGVGIWLKDFTITDPRNLVHGLDLLSERLAESVDPKSLESNAAAFLRDFAPKYVEPLLPYEDFGGMPFARGKLSRTNYSFLRSAAPLGEAGALGDHVLSSLFLNSSREGASRELIRVSASEPVAGGPKFEIIDVNEDYASRLLKSFPAVTDKMQAELNRLSGENQQLAEEAEHLKAEVSELRGLRERIEAFEADPLSTVLTAIQSVDRKIEAMSARVGDGRPPAVVIGRQPGPRTPIRYPDRITDEQFDYNWFMIGTLIFGVLLFMVAVYLALKTWVL